jgi:Helix-turn-helix domain
MQVPLGLPVHEMRLHIHPLEGSGDGLCGSDQSSKEPITVTPTEIIYQRRIAVLDHAQRTGNVAEACRIFNVSRKTYYVWKNLADRYGLEALMPRGPALASDARSHPHSRHRGPVDPGRAPTDIGCRQYADRLLDQGSPFPSRGAKAPWPTDCGRGHNAWPRWLPLPPQRLVWWC